MTPEAGNRAGGLSAACQRDSVEVVLTAGRPVAEVADERGVDDETLGSRV